MINQKEINKERTGGKMKEIFKDKIGIFVIGILLGAIISTGAFLTYTKTVHKDNNPPMQMNGGRHSSFPHQWNNNNNGNNSNNDNNGQPPEKPDNNNNENTQSQDKTNDNA